MCRHANGLNWLIIDSVWFIVIDVKRNVSGYKRIKLAYILCVGY